MFRPDRSISRLVNAARGKNGADLLITNVNLVNTLSGSIERCNVAVKDGVIIGFENYRAEKTVDGQGGFLCPGFIEAHIHIESTLLTPPEFARAVAARGTAVVVCDPHEIANVLGVEGIQYFIRSSADLPVSVYFMLPSCVPATHLETAGAVLDVPELSILLEKYPDRFLGLGEMMNFPGVIHNDPGVMAKLEMSSNLLIDGHAPGLSGKDLNAYILAGPGSDHECVSPAEAKEKLGKGMHIMIREGTSEHNLEDLLPVVNDLNWPNFSLVSDDRHPTDLAGPGHLDYNLRRAVSLGMDPVRAVQMVTINPARYFGLKHRGALAPGYRADMVLLEDLEDFQVQQVFLQGRRREECLFENIVDPPGNSIHISGLNEKSLHVPARGKKILVMDLVQGQIYTRRGEAKPRVVHGLVQADPENDLAKLVVAERHRSTGNVGLGFVRGLGLKKGAIASTVAHDAHNLIVAGSNDQDILAAAEEVQRMKGGLAAVADEKVLASLALPVAGLMSDRPLREVTYAMDLMKQACIAMGFGHENPFMILSFLALPVIPELKLTDMGLVDVGQFRLVDLWSA